MIYLTFGFSALIVVGAAMKLAEYADVIAVRAKLGGMFIGTLLLAGATSLPELLAGIDAIKIGAPAIAVGGVFGSNMFNMFIIGILDLVFFRVRLLRKIANTHSLTAGLAILLASLGVLFILADVDLKIGWVGADSLLIIGGYIVGMRLLQQGSSVPVEAEEIKIDDSIPTLPKALLGFGIASGVLVLIMPLMVSSADQISKTTGISEGFIGATLIAITTSLPEMVATIAAVRLGAYDLAIGNLFGSNIFNMFALGLLDFFYLPGRFLGIIDSSFAIVGLLGIILTSLGLIGNLARLDRRFLFIEFDALSIIICYFLGMYMLFTIGIGI